jgi:cytochrome c oxidase subunit 1
MQAVQPRPSSAPALQFPKVSAIASERWLIGSFVFVALLAVSIGLLLGPAQAYRRAPALRWEIPVFYYYYQALTLHGVLNALVFTTFFIVGFAYFVTQRTLQRALASMQLAWASFVLMLIGVVLAGYAMLTGQANVLYTFYAPMLAHWTFYLGLALVIVGSWVAALVVFMTYFAWRKEHPGEAAPLAVFALLANYLMWFSASLGVAVEVLTMLLPLSLGIIKTTDPQVSRILFWFFGHPLVYFWLIPAYVSWYTMLPKQYGVKLFSDPLARVAFLMIMIFSIPIGVHHLFVDPGISELSKALHSLLTFIVAVPSLLTAFNIGATLEKAGRARGGGRISWMWKQAWGDPVIAAQICGMLVFAVGGVTGMANASFSLNNALHNTTWVPGHFHTTLAGGVFMTYIGIIYWLLPMLRGRALFARPLATAQVYTWFVGILTFGLSMGRAGLEGAIRRTDSGAAGAYVSEGAASWLNFAAVGGTFLLISIILLFTVILGTLFISKREPQTAAPISFRAPPEAPRWTENWNVWVALIIITNVVMWGPVLLGALNWVSGFWSTPYPMN